MVVPHTGLKTNKVLSEQIAQNLSGWHGVSDMVGARNKQQTCAWACIIIIAASGLAFESYHVVNDYRNQPFVIQFDPVYLETQRVPDTVICPQEPFDTIKLRAHNFTQGEIAQLYQVFTPDYYTVPRGWYVGFEQNYDPESKIRGMNLNWETFLEDFGVECKSVLKNCMMNWKFFDCCKEAKPVLHRYFGRCFALKNLDKFHNQTASFHFGGLVVFAKNEPHPNLVDPYGPITSGLSLEIAHNYVANTYEIFNVAPGEMLELALTAEKYVRHPERPGGCLDWDNWQSRMTPHHCWNKGVMQVCDCCLAGYRNDDQKPLCFPKEYSECNTTRCVDSTGRDWCGVGGVADKCRKDMALPICNEWIYATNIKKTKLTLHNYVYTQNLFNFSDEKRSDDLHTFLEEVEVDSTYSLIAVYYTQMGYTEIKEVSTYSIHRFISSIGGELSLFLGASLISLVQLCFFSMKGICEKEPITSKSKVSPNGIGVPGFSADAEANGHQIVT